ncbi:conserved domain protein [Eggerthella sp. HGA1]|nr:conserved domain protein [Eggerthella sp. HGA1]
MNARFRSGQASTNKRPLSRNERQPANHYSRRRRSLSEQIFHVKHLYGGLRRRKIFGRPRPPANRGFAR